MKIFFLGINGISMQALAYVLKKSNQQVYGYDDSLEELDYLKKQGIIYTDKLNFDINYLVYTSTIKEDHFIMQEARKLGVKTIHRVDFFINHMLLNKELIVVTGAHGKTTTTGMIAHLLGKKSYFLGGKLQNESLPMHHEKHKFTIIEADESDGTFSKWNAKYKILLNFDFEHMDFYKTEQNIIEHYKKFIYDKIESTILILNIETKKFLNISDHKNIITFGKKDSGANFCLQNVKYEKKFLVVNINDEEIEIPLLGYQNALNFCAVFALFKTLELPLYEISNFPGIKKRMQKLFKKNDHSFYLDYGHHPAEIQSTLDAFKKHKHINPTIVFEPHKYTRLKYHLDDWIKVFKGREVFVAPIHSAYESEVLITQKEFINILRRHDINASEFLGIDSLDMSCDTICFSAGDLGENLLKKYSSY